MKDEKRVTEQLWDLLDADSEASIRIWEQYFEDKVKLRKAEERELLVLNGLMVVTVLGVLSFILFALIMAN